MEWNRIHFTSISRLFQMTKFITPARYGILQVIPRQTMAQIRQKAKHNSYTTLPPKLLLETAKNVDFKGH